MTARGAFANFGWITYVLHKEDGTPFYVGKGRPRRPHMHEWAARNGHRDHKSNIIRTMLKRGMTPIVVIMLRTDVEAEAFAEERRLITLYRLAGVSLTNATDGGDGSSGSKRTPEQIARMRAASQGRVVTEASRQRLREAQLGKKRLPSTTTTVSEYTLGLAAGGRRRRGQTHG